MGNIADITDRELKIAAATASATLRAVDRARRGTEVHIVLTPAGQVFTLNAALATAMVAAGDAVLIRRVTPTEQLP